MYRRLNSSKDCFHYSARMLVLLGRWPPKK